MSRYAEATTVTTNRSRDEIERTLTRYGAGGFAYGWEDGRALIGFQMHGRRVRFILRMPDPAAREFTHTPTGYARTKAQAVEAHKQAERQRWRALALVVKAKLEAVESGITTFEDEFLAHILLPDGRTYGEFAGPQIDAVYSTGEMPKLLPGLTPEDDDAPLLLTAVIR